MSGLALRPIKACFVVYCTVSRLGLQAADCLFLLLGLRDGTLQSASLPSGALTIIYYDSR